MKYIGISVLIAVAVLLFYPVKSQVEIVKSQIKSNQPFAGLINGQMVGTDICCKYWLEPEKQPDTVRVTVTKPFGLSAIGCIYSAK